MKVLKQFSDESILISSVDNELERCIFPRFVIKFVQLNSHTVSQETVGPLILTSWQSRHVHSPSCILHLPIPWCWARSITAAHVWGLTYCQGQKSRSAPVTSLNRLVQIRQYSHRGCTRVHQGLWQQLALSLKSNMCNLEGHKWGDIISSQMRWYHIATRHW